MGLHEVKTGLTRLEVIVDIAHRLCDDKDKIPQVMNMIEQSTRACLLCDPVVAIADMVGLAVSPADRSVAAYGLCTPCFGKPGKEKLIIAAMDARAATTPKVSIKDLQPDFSGMAGKQQNAPAPSTVQ